MKTCPACGGESPADAEHCAHCPASFPREAPAAAAPSAARGGTSSIPPWTFGAAALALALFLYKASSKGTAAPAAPAEGGAAFDPARDADRDIADALARAKVTRRRVLLEVGGNWCLWCRRMDAFFAANPDVAELRDKGYVLVRVSVTPEKPNAQALSAYPTPAGYPHLYVLEPDGALVFSKDTSELEAGDGYDPVRFAGFLKSFAPPS